MRPHSRYGRRRAAVLTGVYGLIGLHVAHWKVAGRTLAPLEFNEVLFTLHDGIVTAGFVFMAVTVVATAVVGRFFCSWGCHVLALQDFSALLLRKVGIHPKPLRSRALAWIPGIVAGYLAFWPQVKRLARGEAQPALRIVSEAGAWSSFVTDDFCRNLPGPGIALLTLTICGGFIVYLLGSRSFCRYVCPYGAVFAVADHVAPGRIVATGDCSRCGLCTAVCQSQVRVHEEVARFGAVVDPQCLKDLDCVSACPDQVLRFGFTRPPALRGNDRGEVRRSYDVSVGEDAFMATVFVGALLVFRDLYEAVGLLLALALGVSIGFLAVLCLRFVRAPRLALHGMLLKEGGRPTPRGIVFAMLATAVWAFAAHSAFVRYHDARGERMLAVLRASATPPVAADVAAALRHLETAARWGIVRPLGLRHALASLYQMSGATTAAERELRAIVADHPTDIVARVNLGQLLVRAARTAEGMAVLAAVAERSDLRVPRDVRARAAARAGLARHDLAAGRQTDALRWAEGAVRDDPGDASTLLLLGRVLVAGGRFADAESRLARAVELRPDLADAQNDLAVVQARLGRPGEALPHYEAALRLRPGDARVRRNYGAALHQHGNLAAAVRAYEAALAVASDDVDAHVGLAVALAAHGDAAAARAHWRRAGELDVRYSGHALP